MRRAVPRRRSAVTILVATWLAAAPARAQTPSGTSSVALPGQGLSARLSVTPARRWHTTPNYFPKFSSTVLSLVDTTHQPIGADFEFAIAPLAGCAEYLQGSEPPSSTTAESGYAVQWFDRPGAAEIEVKACGAATLGTRTRVALVVAGKLRRDLVNRSAVVAAVLSGLRRAAESGPPAAVRPLVDHPQVAAGAVPRLTTPAGQPIAAGHGQLWREVAKSTSSATFEQQAPYVGQVQLTFNATRSVAGCARWLATQGGQLVVVGTLPRGFAGTQYVARSGQIIICSDAGPDLLTASLLSPLDPSRALAHAGPFIEAVVNAWSQGGASAERAASIARQIDAARRRGAATDTRDAQVRLIRESMERREQERRAAGLPARPQHEPRPTHDSRKKLGVHAFFAEVGLRTWSSPASRVPLPVVADPGTDPGSARVLVLRTGALIERGARHRRDANEHQGFHVAGAIESYYGGSRDGVSPVVYQVELGYGIKSRAWSRAGTANIKHTGHQRADSSGKPCPELDKRASSEEIRDWGRRCNHDLVTTTTTPIPYGAAWLTLRGAVFGGWRYLRNMLGGDSPDPALPLVNGGGPVVGWRLNFKRGWLSGEMTHDLAYYVHGWDDHGKLGYTGGLAGGASFALLEMRWRLDPGVGKELSFGLRLRLDL